MPYAGKTIMPREIAANCREFWQNYELTKAVATGLAESAGSLGAWHDNLGADGNVVSRDCGLFQINMPARDIGSRKEDLLRTESLDPLVYESVMVNNIREAHLLYNEPWNNGNIRLWEPWVAYTSGWATFPEWWVWHQSDDGTPIGPWLKTGRYIQRAIAGQMNYHIVIKKDWSPSQAQYYANRYIGYFGIKGGELEYKDGILVWQQIPKMPSSTPADGVGPRPSPNNGV